MLQTAAEQLSPFSCQTFLEAGEGLADKPCMARQRACFDDFLKPPPGKKNTAWGSQ